jgi:membrane associated rhomboid family serine protease
MSAKLTHLFAASPPPAPDVVEILGKEKFALVYLNGAVVASLASVAWQRRRGTSLPSLVRASFLRTDNIGACMLILSLPL